MLSRCSVSSPSSQAGHEENIKNKSIGRKGYLALWSGDLWMGDPQHLSGLSSLMGVLPTLSVVRTVSDPTLVQKNGSNKNDKNKPAQVIVFVSMFLFC